jgi:N-succinyldiaminopimelate aminotransferase
MARRNPPLVPRMIQHSTSIFGEMSKLALDLNAINLGQGFPDTDGPQALKDAVARAIAEGRGNQYPPAHGVPALRSAIADHQQRFYGISLNPETDVVVTTGASEALAASMLALVEPGDEVILFEPWFDVYEAIVDMAHGVRVGVPMNSKGLRPNLEILTASITARTRLILLNSPHNPTGTVFNREELQWVADLAIKHDLIVIADEAYEHLWFDESQHIPIATLPGMFERTITVGSGGKTFSFTGWKVGWASGPGDLVGAVRTVRQHLSYVSGGPFQWAIAEGLAFPDTYFDDLQSDLLMKRNLLTAGLSALGFDVVTPEGTYFITTDVRPLGYADGLEFCRELPHKAGVVAIPHQVFCADVSIGAPYVRWAFCKQPAVLQGALDRLASTLTR